MPRFLYSDLETFSDEPINRGSYRYAEGAQAEVMLWAYAIDDGPVHVWDLTAVAEMPSDLKAALSDESAMTVWHNGGQFDRVQLRVASPLHIALPTSRIHDTMVQAFAHALPGKLEKLCEVLGVDADKVKDKRGKELIRLFCSPRKFSHNLLRSQFQTNKDYRAAIKAAEAAWPGRATRATHPEKWAEFIEYARYDVIALREIHRKMPMWNYSGFERKLWDLDQRINDRGVLVDLDLAHAAIAAAEMEQSRLASEAYLMTDGDVSATTQRDALLKHILEQYGVALPDLRTSTIDSLLGSAEGDALPSVVIMLLENRLSAAKTSTAKYTRVIEMACADGRLHGLLQFDGAGRTRRWAGRGVQPQNFPRPKWKASQIALGIEMLKLGAADLLFEDVMGLCASALRGLIVAPPGKRLVVSDLSNIEGRGLVWHSGEEWKLAAFRDFDTVLGADGVWYTGPEFFAMARAGSPPALKRDRKGKLIRKGFDLYVLAYAATFIIAPEHVSEYQRQIGKVMELALGYGGGVGAFVTFAAAYNIDLEELADKALPGIPADVIAEAANAWAWAEKNKRTLGLPKRVWIACDALKRLWRRAHPRTVSFWAAVENAARDAILSPGTTVASHRLKFRRDGQWLRIQLPSGAVLCYPSPQVAEDGQISYMGVHQYTRKWTRLHTYAGKLVENIVQSTARDIMACNMFAIEKAGYEIVLTVHDEVITEAPNSDAYSDLRLSGLLAKQPVWAHDIPLAAGGFVDFRYRKG